MTNIIARNPVSLDAWLKTVYVNPNNINCFAEQVTLTTYDTSDATTGLPLPIPVNQKEYTLRNRVSYTRTYDYLVASVNNTPIYNQFDFSTTYNYDIHGNVDTVLQQYKAGLMAAHGINRFKVIAYKYDLISGKVNEVHFQPGQPDQSYHRYEYDAENRLTDAYICDNKVLIGNVNLEEHDAHYEYYKHGPLARMVIGNQQVQGIDYAYNLQGWLKGVNSTGVTQDLDMGNDGKSGSINKSVARDVYGFNLNYFTGDYTAIGGKIIFPGNSAYMPAGENRDLYNGNINSMAVNIAQFKQPQLYNYQYDQLNRIVGMVAYRGYNASSNSWDAITPTTDYKEQVTYDANGNISSYFRNGSVKDGAPLAMDNLAYNYNKDANGNLINNRLRHVNDTSPANNYAIDIDNQSTDNYTYDAIGNLIGDNAEKITNITWSVYGKILGITKKATSTGDVQSIAYSYDPAGNRIGKLVIKKGLPNRDYTWYVRDATGNVMAVYTYAGSSLTSDSLYLSEQHLYGSSRLGIWNRKINMDATSNNAPIVQTLSGPTYDIGFSRGNKIFELSNHLGNVLATISDKKLAHSTGSTGIADYYDADVVTAQDYYPFGFEMPGRKFNSDKATYGFNGKRKDNEIYGEGNAYDFGDRIYSPRLGRWLAVDMAARKSPGETPYRFGHNNPLRFLDPDGSWEEDGHFWTVYAMGVAKGLSKARAYEIAVKAEYYDHYVHQDANGNISMSIYPSASGIAWGKDGGLGTWADPSKQTAWHALTGGLQNIANSVAKKNVLTDGDLNQLHTVGDSWSHSYVDDNGVRKMWGKNLNILGKEFNYTVEHAFGGGHGNENADNISKRPQEYGAYVNDLNNIMNNDLFAFRSEVKNLAPDITVFNYVQQNGKSKENNIFLLQSYIGVMTGDKSFTPANETQANLLQGLFTQLRMGSTMTTTTTTTYTDSSKKKVKSQTKSYNVTTN